MEAVLITVVIPMYNVEKFLENCVASVTAQKVDFLYEIIMVNDGSPDRSLETANKIAATSRNITVISQENKGLGGARNTGILNAKGKYILFLDADDQLAENALSKLITLAEKEKLDILEFAAQGRNENGEIIYTFSNSTKNVMAGKPYYNSVRYMNSACNKLYNTEFLKRHGLFFKERIFIEDFEFNTRVFAKAERVAATDVLGAYFLQTADSITRNTNEEKIKKMQNDIIKVISITCELFETDRDSEDSIRFYRERIGFLTSTLFYQLFKRNAAYQEVKNLRKELTENGIFFPDYKIHDRKKEIFRRLVVKNPYFYPLLLRIKKWYAF